MTPVFPNPLKDLHRQAEAEFQSWADIEIVQTFGEPQAEYAFIHKSAGMIDLPQRGILELTGKDRLPLLNNLLTNQTWDKSKKTGLQAGQGVYAFMLNLRGRIVADMNVLELGDRTLLEMDARLVEPLRAVLEKYLFAEQVKLASRVGALHEIALHGPAVPQLLGIDLNQPLQSAQIKLFDIDAVAWRDDSTGSFGCHLIVPIESAKVVWMNLLTQFGAVSEGAKRIVRPVGWAAFNATRIEAGRPIFGIDFDGAPIATAAPGKKEDLQTEPQPIGALPVETGLFDRAVSVTKGCYLGQEIVARMHARGQVARKIVGIRMETDALPIAGEQVFDEQSNPVGVITSSTVSPVLSNVAICLALVKKPHFELGAKLKVPAEGELREGTIVPLPFVKMG
jgi:folate-binding protein YgfZ